MTLLAILAQWAGAEVVLMEQVSALATHGAGQLLATWIFLWYKAGFQVHMAPSKPMICFRLRGGVP